MSRLVSYLIAGVIAAVGIGARVLLNPVLGHDLPFTTLYAAPILCAWLYGRGPAVLALALSTIGGAYFLLDPRFELDVSRQEHRVGLVLYVALNVMAIAIIEAMRNAQQAAQRKQADLEAEITKRLAVEATLASERGLFFTTLRSIGDCVITTDLNGQIVFMNEVAVQVTGWPEPEAKGKALESVFRIINQETRAVAPNPVQTVLRDGLIVGLANHTMLIARDGHEIPIDDSAAPIRDQDGGIKGVVLVFRDISERYRQAAERQALLVAEQEARQQAERANRLKDQFLATVSHELRTPLNAMLGWCFLLARKHDDPAVVQEGITIIERNAKAQAQLIEDLLDMSAILSGKLRLNTENVDLRQIVEGAVSTVSPAAEAKALTIDYTAPTEPIRVQADPIRLQQVVWNLLTNAIKFSPASRRIEVGVAKADAKACITVRDYGNGIAAELLPLVFERFRQADSSSARKHGGLGLGLAIVKQVVELHHGTVQAHSDGPGQGASFVVELPAGHDLLLVERRAQDRSTLAAAADHNSLSGLSILALDDDVDSLSVLRRVLQERGADVTAVNRAEDAIGMVQGGAFDLIISDLGMPTLDGYGFLRRVAEYAAEHHKSLPPAIALTAYAGAEDIKKSSETGYQAHIAKPFNPEALVFSILKVVGRIS